MKILVLVPVLQVFLSSCVELKKSLSHVKLYRILYIYIVTFDIFLRVGHLMSRCTQSSFFSHKYISFIFLYLFLTLICVSSFTCNSTLSLVFPVVIYSVSFSVLLNVCLHIKYFYTHNFRGMRWHSWLKHCAKSQKFAGSMSLDFSVDLILPAALCP
jgi:hypothetical protein